jgi:hypothetical protein
LTVTLLKSVILASRFYPRGKQAMTFQSSAASGSQRPVAITVICVLSAIGIVLAVIGLVAATSALTAIASWYPIYVGVSIIIGAACTYGLWMMKKWALYLYTAIFVLNQIIVLMLGAFSLVGLAIPLIVVVICWVYQSRMT